MTQIPRVKKAQKLPVVISREEIKKLLAVTTNLKFKTMFMVAYSAGLRVNEITHLKVFDIDSRQMQILVREGKGKIDRYSLLSEVILKFLRQYWKQYRPDVWLFPGKIPGQPMSNRAFQDAFQKARKKSGINTRASLHSLRHSFATHLLENGTDIVRIQHLMGHARIGTTTLYLHLAKSRILEVKSPLDSLLEEDKDGLELQDVFQQFGQAYRQNHSLPLNQLKTIKAIESCRTAGQGGHIDECDSCGHVRVSYNSCRNRHCPKCQGLAKEQWLLERERDLLNIGYFHVVFTGPDSLNPLALQNQKVFYSLLFKAASETLVELSRASSIWARRLVLSQSCILGVRISWIIHMSIRLSLVGDCHLTELVLFHRGRSSLSRLKSFPVNLGVNSWLF